LITLTVVEKDELDEDTGVLEPSGVSLQERARRLVGRRNTQTD